jgi:hypothetical protein
MALDIFGVSQLAGIPKTFRIPQDIRPPSSGRRVLTSTVMRRLSQRPAVRHITRSMPQVIDESIASNRLICAFWLIANGSLRADSGFCWRLWMWGLAPLSGHLWVFHTDVQGMLSYAIPDGEWKWNRRLHTERSRAHSFFFRKGVRLRPFDVSGEQQRAVAVSLWRWPWLTMARCLKDSQAWSNCLRRNRRSSDWGDIHHVSWV